jgi:hypothetical protein
MPISIIGEYLVYNTLRLAPGFWIGAALVLIGFIAVNYSSYQQSTSSPEDVQ